MNVLREEYGIVPTGMLGHSAGEIPAGYADGCLTLRQVRDKPSNNPNFAFVSIVLGERDWELFQKG